MISRTLLSSFLALLACTGIAAGQTTWYVDAAATAPGDGSQAAPYASIQFAHSQPTTVNGDTLLVAEGEYVENLLFCCKTVTLIGAGAERSIIRPSGPGHVVTMNGFDGITMRGFTITGAYGMAPALPFAPAEPGAGLMVRPFAHVTLEDCVVRDCDATGIIMSYELNMTRCTIVGTVLGLEARIGFFISGTVTCNVLANNGQDFNQAVGSGFMTVDCNQFGASFWDPANNDYHLREEVFGSCGYWECPSFGVYPFDPDYVPESYESYCFGAGEEAPGCTPCPCSNEHPGGLGGCMNSSGSGGRLVATGLASVAADTLRIEALDLPRLSFAVLFSGDNRLPSSVANPCQALATGLEAFDGLRCMGANLLRHGNRPSDADGKIGFTGPGWGPPDGPTGGFISSRAFVSGQTRHFQAFFRDNVGLSCGTGRNSTQGVTVTFVP